MHHGEVGSISNTGKLMLTTGVAKGAVTGLEAGALAPEDRQALGLMSQVRYAPPTTPQHTATLQHTVTHRNTEHDCNTATRLHFHNPLAVFVCSYAVHMLCLCCSYAVATTDALRSKRQHIYSNGRLRCAVPCALQAELIEEMEAAKMRGQ